VNPDKMKQVPFTNDEITVLIRLLTNTIPAQDEQEIVWNIINRLRIILKL
jgi:hypothetical protein